MAYVKSPIFYMGNKFDLLNNMFMCFPKKEEVNLFIDLFGGSGVVSANVPYDNVLYNELDHNIVRLFEMLYVLKPEVIIKHIKERIVKFDLYNKTTAIRKHEIKNEDLKIREEANKKYLYFRKFYNESREKNLLDLFTLTYFSFSNLIRFNSKSEFNMPFGDRCFLKGDHDIQIVLFHELLKKKALEISNKNAFDLLESIKSNVGQFIYLDPPYTNTMAIYNESRAFGGWNIKHDMLLFQELDRLNELGIKWAMSNVLINKGKENNHLKDWAIKNNYTIIDFENKQYSALGKGNARTQEVLIINYEAPFERFDIFDFINKESD